MSDFASSLTWFGDVWIQYRRGERTVSVVVMDQLAKSMHGERGYGPVSKIHARRAWVWSS